MSTFTTTLPPFDPALAYPHHWQTPLYLWALGGSLFSHDGLSIFCTQYSTYINARETILK